MFGTSFFGLKEDELRHEILNEVSSQEIKIVSKLRAAENIIKDLRTKEQELISTNKSRQTKNCILTEETEKSREMDLKLTKLNEEQVELQRDLDIEKNKVLKLVSQTVDRDHEILREELANRIEFYDRLAEFPNHLIDKVVDLEREKQVLEKEEQKLESFIDSLPRQWKDRLR